MLEQSVPDGFHPMEGTDTVAAPEELQPMQKTMERIVEVCLLWEGLCAELGAESEEKRAEEATCD